MELDALKLALAEAIRVADELASLWLADDNPPWPKHKHAQEISRKWLESRQGPPKWLETLTQMLTEQLEAYDKPVNLVELERDAANVELRRVQLALESATFRAEHAEGQLAGLTTRFQIEIPAAGQNGMSIVVPTGSTPRAVLAAVLSAIDAAVPNGGTSEPEGK